MNNAGTETPRDFLLSDECSGYVTETNLQVDGGAAVHHVWAESGR